MKLTKRKSGRYRTEMHLLRQLRGCPNVVELKKVLEDDGVYVLILEQAPMTLEQLLHESCTQQPMSLSVARVIIKDMLSGLRAVHELGFVHKDIKPENILIFADRQHRRLQAKLADFGFSCRVQPGTGILQDEAATDMPDGISPVQVSEWTERVQDRCGTPGYWSPELVAGIAELRHAFKMDVFSAGATLYRMLCNEMPFGLFDTWQTKTVDNMTKLTKLKPTFQIMIWIPISTQPDGSLCKTTKIPEEEIQYERQNAPTSFSLTASAIDLMRGMLRIRPHKRFSVRQCLEHEWVRNMNEID